MSGIRVQKSWTMNDGGRAGELLLVFFSFLRFSWRSFLLAWFLIFAVRNAGRTWRERASVFLYFFRLLGAHAIEGLIVLFCAGGWWVFAVTPKGRRNLRGQSGGFRIVFEIWLFQFCV
jgi:hypothetical protein